MIEARFRSRNRRDRGYVHRAAWPTKSRPSLTANRRFLRSHQARPFRSADRQRNTRRIALGIRLFSPAAYAGVPRVKPQCFFTTRFESAVHDEVAASGRSVTLLVAHAANKAARRLALDWNRFGQRAKRHRVNPPAPRFDPGNLRHRLASSSDAHSIAGLDKTTPFAPSSCVPGQSLSGARSSISSSRQRASFP
jgi:hypothetical protein